jgi:flotillin
VREHVVDDLANMGFKLVSYTVQKIEDYDGYMEALGTTQTAIVQREADEGIARNENEARKKVALYISDADIETAKVEKESHVQMNKQQQIKIDSDKDLNLLRADFKQKLNKVCTASTTALLLHCCCTATALLLHCYCSATALLLYCTTVALVKDTLHHSPLLILHPPYTLQANEEASSIIRITRAEQEKIIIREQTEAKTEEALVMVKVSDAQMARVKTEAEGHSLAQLLRQQNEAKGVEAESTAAAAKIRAMGLAEASAIQSKGLAEASVLREKAVAFSEYGQAAVVQSIVDRLPEIVESIARPLGKTEKMVFISNGDPKKKAARAAAAKASGKMPTGELMFPRKEPTGAVKKPQFAKKPKQSTNMFGRKKLNKPMFARKPPKKEAGSQQQGAQSTV